MTTETTWQPHDKRGRLTRQSDLPDTVFAFPEQRKEPLTDADHVRGAVARFDQVIDVSEADRALAFANIQKAARYYTLNLPETDWHQLGVHPQQNGKAAAAKAAATAAPEGPASLAVRDRPCIDCLEEAAPSRKTGVTVRPAAFWLVAYLFGAVMLGQTIPTPLYVLYQARLHFSSGIVRLVFAANAAAILAALLLAGRVSDQVGRRPVLAACSRSTWESWPSRRRRFFSAPRPSPTARRQRDVHGRHPASRPHPLRPCSRWPTVTWAGGPTWMRANRTACRAPISTGLRVTAAALRRDQTFSNPMDARHLRAGNDLPPSPPGPGRSLEAQPE